MKTLFVFLFSVLLSVSGSSQILGFGIGYTSSGDVPVTLQLQIKKVGGYITYISEKHPITPDYTGIWHNETTLGLTYEFRQDYPVIDITAGIGWNHTYEFKRRDAFPNAIYSIRTEGTSFEFGFNIRALRHCQWLSANVSMGNYAGLKVMMVCRIRLIDR